MSVKFSNPRDFAEFDDWPSGGNRVKCKFEIERKPGKTRVVRTTTDKFGYWQKPKKNTYSADAKIVDGDDGRTYIIRLTSYGFIDIDKSDFYRAEDPVFQRDSPERYEELIQLFKG